jgi:phosphoglycolate phosphatase
MLARRALPPDHREVDAVNLLVARFHEEYSNRWDRCTRPFPGVPQLLTNLAHRQTRLAVFSNKSQSFTDATVKKLLNQFHFEEIVGAQPAVPVKPSPVGAIAIAQRMGVDSSAFLYLGDSGVDMRTATSAGMYPVAALWGYRGREELEAAGAKTLISEPEDLLELL